MQGDKIVVDGIKYLMDNLADLPMEFAAYKAAEKMNKSTLVFHENYLCIVISTLAPSG